MPTWSPTFRFGPPQGLSPLAGGVSSLASAAGALLGTAETGLNVAEKFLSTTAAPQASAARALISGVQGLVGDLFGAGVFAITAHPWTPGLGQGEGAWRHLDFPRLVHALSDSLDDAGDPERPQFSSSAQVEMIVIAAGTASPSQFASTLEALATLLGTRELKLALRRVQGALQLEEQRYARQVGSVPPNWHSLTLREVLPALKPVEAALQETLGTLNSYAAASETAIAAAIDLIQGKSIQLRQLKDKLTAALELFATGVDATGIYTLHTQGEGGNRFLQSELRGAVGAPGPELSFCAGLALVGGHGSLSALQSAMQA